MWLNWNKSTVEQSITSQQLDLYSIHMAFLCMSISILVCNTSIEQPQHPERNTLWNFYFEVKSLSLLSLTFDHKINKHCPIHLCSFTLLHSQVLDMSPAHTASPPWGVEKWIELEYELMLSNHTWSQQGYFSSRTTCSFLANHQIRHQAAHKTGS